MAQKKGSFKLSQPSRLWFMSRGCKQVPPDEIKGKILWAHPEGYFLNAQGQKLTHDFSPTSQRGFTAAQPSAGGFHGGCYPTLRRYGSKSCHSLMALAFYGKRPVFENTSLPLQGKGQERGQYVGICHHLIPDKLDYRPANLLCWLTDEQHREADRRQRILRKTLPDGDLRILPYEWHRVMQDPRITTADVFQRNLQTLIDSYGDNA